MLKAWGEARVLQAALFSGYRYLQVCSQKA